MTDLIEACMNECIQKWYSEQDVVSDITRYIIEEGLKAKTMYPSLFHFIHRIIFQRILGAFKGSDIIIKTDLKPASASSGLLLKVFCIKTW